MQLKKLTPGLNVSSQITPADVALAVKQGFKAIINNRPDGESQDQPEAAEIRYAALQHGLEYRHLPVVSGALTDRDADAFAALLAELPGPVLAFCRTGTRSATLWAHRAGSENR